MRFTDIKFTQRRGSKKAALGMCLPGDYWVSKSLVDEAWTHACAGLPPPGCKKLHTSKSMYGSKTWKPLKRGVQIALGRCVKYFVDHGMLPLKIINPTKKGTRKYIRI